MWGNVEVKRDWGRGLERVGSPGASFVAAAVVGAVQEVAVALNVNRYHSILSELPHQFCDDCFIISTFCCFCKINS